MFFSVFFLTLSLYAAEKHQHGSAELSLAFDGANGKIELKSPSDSIFGFEHAARTAHDKKVIDEGLKKFEKNIDQMISFDPALKCQFNKEKIEMVFEGKNHSSTVANFNIKCEKSLLGSKITFHIQKFFPRLKTIDAHVIVDSIQKSLKIESSGNGLELK